MNAVAKSFLTYLRDLAATVAGVDVEGTFLFAAFVRQLHRRLARATRRFERLVESFAGFGPFPPSKPRSQPAPGARKPSDCVLSNRRGIALGIQEAHAYAVILRARLADPEFLAFIAADPRCGRILRPLCRLLGVDLPPILRLPRQPSPRTRTRSTARAAAERRLLLLQSAKPITPADHPLSPREPAPGRYHQHYFWPPPRQVMKVSRAVSAASSRVQRFSPVGAKPRPG